MPDAYIIGYYLASMYCSGTVDHLVEACLADLAESGGDAWQDVCDAFLADQFWGVRKCIDLIDKLDARRMAA